MWSRNVIVALAVGVLLLNVGCASKADFEKHMAEFRTLESRSKSLDNKLKLAEKDMGKMGTRLLAELDTLKTRTTDADKRIAETQDSQTKAESAASGERAALKAQIADAKKEMGTLSTDLAALKQRFGEVTKALQKDIESARNQLVSARQDLTKLTQTASDHQRELARHETSLGAMSRKQKEMVDRLSKAYGHFEKNLSAQLKMAEFRVRQVEALLQLFRSGDGAVKGTGAGKTTPRPPAK